MRTINGLLLTLGLGLLVGCTSHSKTYPGKTVDKFVGALTYNGGPVNFPADQKAQLEVHLHESAYSLGIPIKEDGTFDIGWMPVGKYSVMLMWQPGDGGKKRGPGLSRYNLPEDSLTIEDGKTEYVIELGKDFKR